MDDATLAALRTLASAVFDVGFATMVGALATSALLRDAWSDWAARRVRGCRALLLASGAVSLIASVAWIEVQAIAMTELPPGAALLAAGGVIVDTQFGHAWAVATGAILACIALVAITRHGPRWPQALALAIAAGAHAGAGHAGANGFCWLLPVMTLHLLATAAWAGGVFAAALVVLRGDAPAGDGARYAARLSTLATASLVVVALTGVAGAWHGLGGSLAPLRPASGSAWGTALDAKLALAALAVALGGFNRFAAMPSLPASWPRFAAVLRVEAVVLLAALLAAAWLANGEPPAA